MHVCDIVDDLRRSWRFAKPEHRELMREAAVALVELQERAERAELRAFGRVLHEWQDGDGRTRLSRHLLTTGEAA